jgi:hypothetical protein
VRHRSDALDRILLIATWSLALLAGCPRARHGCSNAYCAPEARDRPTAASCQRLAAALGEETDRFRAAHGDPDALCNRSTNAILACEGESNARCRASNDAWCRSRELGLCMAKRRAEAAIAQGFVAHVSRAEHGGVLDEDRFGVIRLAPSLHDVGLDGKVWRADRERGWIFIPIFAGHCFEHVTGYLCATGAANAPSSSREGEREFISLTAPGLSHTCLNVRPPLGARERYRIFGRWGAACLLVEAEH